MISRQRLELFEYSHFDSSQNQSQTRLIYRAGTIEVVVAIPVELHFDSAELVGEDFFIRVRGDDHRCLGPDDMRLGRNSRRAKR